MNSSKQRAVLLYLAGAVFLLFGVLYFLAALGVEPLADRLGDSMGGPWVQGAGAIALAVGAFIWGKRVGRQG